MNKTVCPYKEKCKDLGKEMLKNNKEYFLSSYDICKLVFKLNLETKDIEQCNTYKKFNKEEKLDAIKEL